jgi:hypothetical protein
VFNKIYHGGGGGGSGGGGGGSLIKFIMMVVVVAAVLGGWWQFCHIILVKDLILTDSYHLSLSSTKLACVGS